MSPQFMLMAMQVVPGLTQLFTSVILPVADKLLRFTIPRIGKLPLYFRLLWTIYSGYESNSEARKYLTSVLVLLGSILTFMTWSYVPFTGVPIIGIFTTPIAGMIALVVSLVALEFIFKLNQEYFANKYPQEFALVQSDIDELSRLLGKFWEEMIEETQSLLNVIKQQLDPNGIYDDSISASINALNAYLWMPENNKSLPPDEVHRRIVTEGLPPLAKVVGSIAEGAFAGSIVGTSAQSIAASMFVKAGFWTSVKATFGLTSGFVVAAPMYGLLTVAAPIGLAVIAGLGVGQGVKVLRNEGEKKKLSAFLSDVIISALPMAWIDGSFTAEEREILEKLMLHASINDENKRRIRTAMNEQKSFEDILHSGLLQEKNPIKMKLKNRLLLAIAYEVAKADGVISENEIDLHSRMASFMDFEQAEIREIRRLVLLTSGINVQERLKIVKGSLVQQESVEAIVSSTNVTLLPNKKIGLVHLPTDSRNLDAIIHRSAGTSLKKECKSIGHCAVGEAKITQGFNLPNQWVIHTVTPIWKDGNWEEQELLRQCYRNSLTVAHQHSIRSIAFPALGTRTGKVPIAQSARIAVSEAQQFLNTHFNVEQVILVCWDEQTYEEYMRAFEEIVGVLDVIGLLEEKTVMI